MGDTDNIQVANKLKKITKEMLNVVITWSH